MEGSELDCVVLDIGSDKCRVGFAGQEKPHATFPNIIGRIRYCGGMIGFGSKQSYIGDEAVSKRGILTLKRTIDEQCRISSFDDYEKVLHHAFYNELRVAPEEYKVIMTEQTFFPENQKLKCTEMMFETFNTPLFQWANESKLSLYASGLQSGVVVDMGYTHSSVTPIIENEIIKEETKINYNCNGKLVDDELLKLFIENGRYFTSMLTQYGRGKIIEIKEDVGEVYQFSIAEKNYLLLKNLELFHSSNGKEINTDVRNIISSYLTRSYFNLSDERETKVDFSSQEEDNFIFKIGSERWKCFEIYFNGVATILGENPRITSMIKDSIIGVNNRKFNLNFSTLDSNLIEKSDNSDITNQLLDNIVLCGGASMCTGMKDRLEYEVKNYFQKEIKFHSSDYRSYLAWLGGSKLGAIQSNSSYISFEQYGEVGPNIVLGK